MLKDIAIESNDEYNALNSWLFEVQINLMNAAKFSFTNNYEDIMSGEYNQDLFKNTFHEETIILLKSVSKQYAFINQDVNILELSSENIIEFYLEKLIPAFIKYDTDEKLSCNEKRYINLVSENYLENYKIISEELSLKYSDNEEKLMGEKLYHRLLIVMDFIAGMTDSYARDLYRQLIGLS